MTKDEIIAGLRAGRTLICDRKDATQLPMLLEMEQQGLIESEMVQYDEQSSAIKFRWKAEEEETGQPDEITLLTHQLRVTAMTTLHATAQDSHRAKERDAVNRAADLLDAFNAPSERESHPLTDDDKQALAEIVAVEARGYMAFQIKRYDLAQNVLDRLLEQFDIRRRG